MAFGHANLLLLLCVQGSAEPHGIEYTGQAGTWCGFFSDAVDDNGHGACLAHLDRYGLEPGRRKFGPSVQIMFKRAGDGLLEIPFGGAVDRSKAKYLNMS
ncbi:hypothetical protein [Asticcacaulis sp. AC460]|uniref:hypothetical protein n=1 Tax=Asticcacaulis sp. AC460 TaxID=1282360 RepID=UPI00138AEB88|nr:hypothetical protein [Asticcacaulis sp. AC460]